MYRAIARNKRNTILILLVFLVLLGGLGLLAQYAYGRPGDWTVAILVVAGAALYALIQYFFADKQAIAMSGAVGPITKADEPRLYRTVENLSIATGTPMPKSYIVPDEAPNAFATGRDPQHAVVAATTGLLELLDDNELEGVMAHELGHVRNYDIRVSLVVYGLVVAIGTLSDILLRMAFFGRGRNNNPVVMVFGLVAIFVAPFVAMLVQLAISRQREYLADATAALTTRYPDGLASALAKLEAYGGPLRRQNSSMAHLWIANPLKPGGLDRLFSTHPPIEERIRRLHEMGGSF